MPAARASTSDWMSMHLRTRRLSSGYWVMKHGLALYTTGAWSRQVFSLAGNQDLRIPAKILSSIGWGHDALEGVLPKRRRLQVWRRSFTTHHAGLAKCNTRGCGYIGTGGFHAPFLAGSFQSFQSLRGRFHPLLECSWL